MKQAIPVALTIGRLTHAAVEMVHVHDALAVASALGVGGGGAPMSSPLLSWSAVTVELRTMLNGVSARIGSE